MDKNLRLLWSYDHPTARYQEVNFYMDAGLEVVVTLGDPGTLRFDRNYHNETDPLYPAWRSSVTLPASVVERLRRINLTQYDGRIDPADAELINDTIDLMIVAADAPAVANIMTWYKGRLLYRVMGAPDKAGMLRNLFAVDEIAAKSGGRVVLAPGMKNLVPYGAKVLDKDVVHLNGWVDPERILAEWKGRSSDRAAVTAISYIDGHPFFQDQYRRIKGSLTAAPLRVVGKNDKRALECADPEIVGALPVEALHAAMASGRVFVDAGTAPEHLIWPPVEAMQMGVPVLFGRWSGLAAVGFDEGYDEDTLAAAGMCEDFEAINAFLDRYIDDFDRLEAIVERQNALFLTGAFSRDKAMGALQSYLEGVRAARTRAAGPDSAVRLAALAEASRRKVAEAPEPNRLHRNDGELLARTGRLVRPREFRGDVGRLELDVGGHFVRRAVEGRDAPGPLMFDYLPHLPPGDYALRIALEVSGVRGEVGTLIVGRILDGQWSSDHVVARANADGYREALVLFRVDAASSGVNYEVKLEWSGAGKITLLWAQLSRRAFR